MIGEQKSQLFTVQLHNGLHLLKTSAMIYYKPSKKQNGFLLGEKQDCLIWFVTVVTGVFLVNVHGAFQFQSFMLKTVNQLLQMKQLITFQLYSVNMVQMFGLNGR